MKKKTLLCMLAFFLFLTGCVGNSTPKQTESSGPIMNNTDPMPGYDAQNQYLLTSAVGFQETESYFCGSNLFGNYLHYYDKKSGVSGVLCADPACTHDSPSCGAYIKSGATMSCYDGKLYWIAQDNSGGPDFYLWRSNLSGGNREKVKRLGFEEIILPYQPQQYVIHRGKLYILGRDSEVEGTKINYRVTLLSTSLDSSEEFTTVFEKTVDCGIETTIRFVGNAVYISVMTFPEGGPYDLAIVKYNIPTETSENIFEETKIKEIPGAIWVTAREEIYLPGAGSNGAYVWKLENGKRIETVSWTGHGSFVPCIMDGIAVCIYIDGGIRYACVSSLSGEPVYNGKLFPEEIPGLEGDPNEHGFAIIGGDADKIILNLNGLAETGIVDYILMLDLRDNLKPTVLWSSQT